MHLTDFQHNKIMVNKKISEYIKTKGISQSELSRKTGIAQPNLNRILASDDLRLSHLIAITKALEVPVTFFFDGNEHLSNVEINSLETKINLLEKQLEIAIGGLGECQENSSKLLQAVSIFFTSKNAEDVEKVRQVLVSLVDFFKSKNSTSKSIDENKNKKKK